MPFLANLTEYLWCGKNFHDDEVFDLPRYGRLSRECLPEPLFWITDWTDNNEQFKFFKTQIGSVYFWFQRQQIVNLVNKLCSNRKKETSLGLKVHLDTDKKILINYLQKPQAISTCGKICLHPRVILPVEQITEAIAGLFALVSFTQVKKKTLSETYFLFICHNFAYVKLQTKETIYKIGTIY